MLSIINRAVILSIIFSLAFSLKNEFFIVTDNEKHSVVSIEPSISIIDVIDGYARIVREGVGHTTEIGMPELASFTTYFQIDPQKEYKYELEVLDSYIIEDINILPYQGVSENWEIEKVNKINDEFYQNNSNYPIQKLIVSDRVQGRGLEMVGFTVIPFDYDAKNQKLEIFSKINIHIIELKSTRNVVLSQPQRSYVFDKLYSGFVTNYKTSDRHDDYQDPAILYICSGTSESNNDFKDLIEWRRKRGYTVYTASLSDIGSSSSAIKSYIQNAYETFIPSPEYVALVGDVDGSYSLPTYYQEFGHNSYGNDCEGDHPYSQLDGTDLIPEVLIGRMSIRSGAELSVVSNKIINYEKATYLGYLDNYFERAALAGDPSTSGNSCVITNEYIEETLKAHGFEDVRLKVSGSNWSTWMEDELEEGALFFNYRGYLGMSGFSTSSVDNANNGYKLPFATVLTCGTGSFAEDQTTMSEKLFRAGTSSNPKGAVAAIGTATWNTHTLFNNIVDMGIYDGLLADQVETAGAALASGKLALYNTYPTNPDYWISAFTQWNNLIGDPATHLWTDTPKIFNVSHNSEISQGTNFLEVLVQDDLGNNVEGARISLWNRSISNPINLFTNIDGKVQFDFSNISSDSYSITVSKNNFQPYLSEVSVTDLGRIINLSSENIIIDDSSGNADGLINPGESIEIAIPLENFGTENVSGVSATLFSNSEYVEIISNSIIYNDIDIGSIGYSDSFILNISPASIHNQDLDITIHIEDDMNNQWESIIDLDIIGSHLVVEGANNLEFDIVNSFSISLINLGQVSQSDIFANLYYQGSEIEISSGYSSWDPIASNQSGSSLQNFELTISDNIINGTILELDLHIQSNSGYDRFEKVSVQVGEVSVIDPLGPDEYGYYIYDSQDIGYDLSPSYDWIEIDPAYGGEGTDLNLSNNGNGNWSGNGPIAHIDLPFPFKFYGIDYEKITVCTNGWIALGHSELESFRNYSIPGAGGPSPMIAAFWDDLETTGNGDVFTYTSDNNDYFIIQWSDMNTHSYGSLETFQIILYNGGSQPYGDGDIKIQYKTFNNTSAFINQYPPIHGSYSTIGIENHLSTQGLEYSYNNIYPTAAMVLENESSLFITTSPPISLPDPNLSYNLESIDFTVNQNDTDSAELVISNTGEEESLLTYSVSVSGIPPFNNIGGGPDIYGYLWSDSNIDIALDYNWIDIEGLGEPLLFSHNDYAVDGVNIGFEFPFYGIEYSECIINPNGWIGFGEDNTAYSNSEIPSTSSPLAAIFGFWDDLNPVSSDQGGCPEGSGLVYTYSYDDKFIVWFDSVNRCASGEGLTGIYDFQFVIHLNGDININYRNISGYTTSATVGIQNTPGDDGLMVVYNSEYVASGLSLSYSPSDNADWLQIAGQENGEILYGDEEYLNIIANSTDLTIGQYLGNIIISSNSQSNVLIPVSLEVLDDSLILGDINEDGLVNVLDVVSLVNIILNNYDFNQNGDVNQDGFLNVLDVVVLVNIILN